MSSSSSSVNFSWTSVPLVALGGTITNTDSTGTSTGTGTGTGGSNSTGGFTEQNCVAEFALYHMILPPYWVVLLSCTGLMLLSVLWNIVANCLACCYRYLTTMFCYCGPEAPMPISALAYYQLPTHYGSISGSTSGSFNSADGSGSERGRSDSSPPAPPGPTSSVALDIPVHTHTGPLLTTVADNHNQAPLSHLEYLTHVNQQKQHDDLVEYYRQPFTVRVYDALDRLRMSDLFLPSVSFSIVQLSLNVAHYAFIVATLTPQDLGNTGSDSGDSDDAGDDNSHWQQYEQLYVRYLNTATPSLIACVLMFAHHIEGHSFTQVCLRVLGRVVVVLLIPPFLTHVLPMLFAYIWLWGIGGLVLAAILVLLSYIHRSSGDRDPLLDPVFEMLTKRVSARGVALFVAFQWSIILFATILLPSAFNYGVLLYDGIAFHGQGITSPATYFAVIRTEYNLRQSSCYLQQLSLSSYLAQHVLASFIASF